MPVQKSAPSIQMVWPLMKAASLLAKKATVGGRHGVLRLRHWLASRARVSAQDDKFGLLES